MAEENRGNPGFGAGVPELLILRLLQDGAHPVASAEHVLEVLNGAGLRGPALHDPAPHELADDPTMSGPVLHDPALHAPAFHDPALHEVAA